MNEPLVHVIVLSYNGKQLTLDCLSSVLLSEYGNFVIVVVDNASSDQSADAIRHTFVNELASGKMILIENKDNLGFAGGNNVGMEYAFRNHAEYLLLLNNDTVVDKKLLQEMIRVCESDTSIGIAGPKIYYHSPPDQIWFAGGETLLYKGLSRHIGIRETDRGQFDKNGDCEYVTGCAMLIRRKVVEQIGYLDTIYPMYSEDSDYCMRAKRAGYRIFYVSTGKVWHKISAATGGQLKWRKIRLRLWSNFIFLKRYARWYHWISIPVYFLMDAFRVLLSVMSGRIKN